MSTEFLVATPSGDARVHQRPVAQRRGLLVLGHGAGGGIAAPDLGAATAAARELGIEVALVEQPYRVVGRRSPAPAPALDAAWTAVLARLTVDLPADLPLIVGGRSSGARVACRTAAAVGADAVLCLAFPLNAPARKDGTRPSRQAELDVVTVPVLVVQGRTDAFGMPEPTARRQVLQLAGDHGLKKDLPGLRAGVAAWLPTVTPTLSRQMA